MAEFGVEEQRTSYGTRSIIAPLLPKTLFRDAVPTGQNPFLRLTLPGPTLAQHPVEDVANGHLLRTWSCIRNTSSNAAPGCSNCKPLSRPCLCQ